VDPLEWNETLAEASERWVENCVWEHSGGNLLEGGYGENLFGESFFWTVLDESLELTAAWIFARRFFWY